MMARYSSLLAFAIVLLIGLTVVLGVQLSGLPQRLSPPDGAIEALSDTALSDDPTPIIFDVNRGESTKSIAERLESAGIIRSAWFFSTMVQLKGVESELKAGQYELRASMRPSEIMARLQQGVGRGRRVVVPEGWRLGQVADLLEREGITSRQAFLDAAAHASTDPSFGRPADATAEGYLFPDTYIVPADITADGTVALMVHNFERRVDSSLRQRAVERGQTIHQVLIVASIVEREAVVGSERPLIASVYYNRLKAGMPLQADPTVQYAVAGNDPPTTADGYWKKELTQADLNSTSPYNTYRAPGLPPGPISNPGLASIKAALDPAESDYLYFVAKPDGSHAFARTFEEHLQNVRKFRPGD
ncbi:MAG: endolytic transglycosylase MltG [Bacteroidetes bacterium]|nr:endolytic transglycosylase MltG [Bacteroidota bacterium]